MGSRYWITGTQIAVMKVMAENLSVRETDKILEILKEITKKQFICSSHEFKKKFKGV